MYCKIGTCKIYKNGNLRYNLIPVKNEFGVSGLYDTINQRFYKSITSTPFVAGPTV